MNDTSKRDFPARIQLLLPPGALDAHPKLRDVVLRYSPTDEHRNLSRNEVYACDLVVFALDTDWQHLNTDLYYAITTKTAFMLQVNAATPDEGGHLFQLSVNGQWVARGKGVMAKAARQLKTGGILKSDGS